MTITITDLGVLSGGMNSFANDLTNASLNQVKIIGSIEDSSGAKVAVLWNSISSAPITLGTLGGFNSYAYGINNAPTPLIVGASEIGGSPGLRAFVYNGTMTQLPSLNDGLLGEKEAIAISVNLSGEIVGYAENGNTEDTHAVLWTPTGLLGAYVIHDLGTLGTGFNSLANDINESRTIVGASETGNGNIEAFVRQTNTNSPLVSLVGGLNSTAEAITISGTTTYVVGQSETATGSAHAVVWKAPSGTTFGLPTDLGALSGGLKSTAIDIASVGGTATAVGGSQISTGAVHAVKFTGF
ncbi:hypothetical protein [Bacillus thuringiensis]|uniref:hypothetical protein n=1 Tax=Bacillus thuringiensis TaxID=1428 RepID=UPI000676D17B|nr:hypothetical protein [Bacillus thuringiensis]AKR13099.1 hypothetical protein AC241_31050 [Bacillus thuringiensis]MBZ8126108.1 HAF repeat-containing protein [Bacillus thuringiensis]